MIMKKLNGETIQNVGEWQPVGLDNYSVEICSTVPSVLELLFVFACRLPLLLWMKLSKSQIEE